MDFIKQMKSSLRKKFRKNKKKTEVEVPKKEDSQDDYVQEEEIEFKISRERYEYYKGSPLKAVWVGGDQINGLDSPLSNQGESNEPFPKCEMPSETLARIKARQDSLSRMQGVPLGLKPLQHRSSSLAEDSILSRCKLLSAEAFARISEGSGCPEDEGNYLDMSDLSDPPNYDDFMYLRINEPEDSDYINLIDRNGSTPPPSYYEVMRK